MHERSTCLRRFDINSTGVDATSADCWPPRASAKQRHSDRHSRTKRADSGVGRPERKSVAAEHWHTCAAPRYGQPAAVRATTRSRSATLGEPAKVRRRNAYFRRPMHPDCTGLTAYASSVQKAGRFTRASCAMRAFWVFTLAVEGLLSCEDSFSSKPPPLTPESFTPSAPSSAPLSPSPIDAGPLAAQDSFHMMTIMLCSASPQPCLPLGGDASTNASYRVVFGSGRAAIRSRGQVTTDLYNELRDRTTSGEQVDVELYVAGDAGSPPAGFGGGSSAPNVSSGNESLTQCAFRLTELVDRGGEVTLDVIHEFGSSGCRVSLGRFAADPSASQCLIQEPERSRRPGNRKGGMQF